MDGCDVGVSAGTAFGLLGTTANHPSSHPRPHSALASSLISYERVLAYDDALQCNSPHSNSILLSRQAFPEGGGRSPSRIMMRVRIRAGPGGGAVKNGPVRGAVARSRLFIG